MARTEVSMLYPSVAEPSHNDFLFNRTTCIMRLLENTARPLARAPYLLVKSGCKYAYSIWKSHTESFATDRYSINHDDKTRTIYQANF